MEFIFKSNNIKEGKVVKFNRNSDITKNMKLIEWMKNEILMSVSELFNILFKGVRSADEGLQDILANIIMITYLLAKRLGISFNEIDYKIKEKISLGIKEDHSIEKWYGDLTNLKNHIEFFANTDEISDDAITLDTEELVLEAIAQKFAREAESLDEMDKTKEQD